MRGNEAAGDDVAGNVTVGDDVASNTPARSDVAGDDRRRLHEIVAALPDDDVNVARQLLELLAKGRAAPRAAGDGSRDDGAADAGDDDDEDDEDGPGPTPETLAKLAQLSDHELLHLDALLANDPAGVRHFWRERFGEELEDDGLTGG